MLGSPMNSIATDVLASQKLFNIGDAYTRQKTRPSLVQIMACRLFGAKPLSEPMLEYC